MRYVAWALAFVFMLMAWGALDQLNLGRGALPIYPLVVVLTFLAIVVHEFGHAWAARRSDCNVRAVVALPFELTFRPLRLKMARYPKDREIGGYVIYEPGRSHTRRKAIFIAAAGPLANVVAALVVLGVSYLLSSWNAAPRALSEIAPIYDGMLPPDTAVRARLEAESSGRSTDSAVLVAHAWAILSAGMGLVNLLPFRGSDGAAILRQLRRRAI